MAGRGQETIQNPCSKWFKWAGSTGTVQYYDKETKQNVEVALPFTFLLLDVLSTVKGYDEGSKSSIWSNEVRDIKNSIMTIKIGSEVLASGHYQDIKAAAIAKGGGYAASCYIAFKDESGKLVIGNMTMTGSSLGGGVHKPADKKMKDEEVGAWIEFTKNHKNEIYKKAIQVNKDERVCTQGATKFFCPKFTLIDTNPETDKAAIELNNELQSYLETYLKIEAKPTEAAAPTTEAAPQITKEQQFENNSEDKPFIDAPKEKQVVIQEESSDLPF
jgi:hypothetical protein